MEWNRSEALALAADKCAYCEGQGLRVKKGAVAPCNCVLRSIFRACYERFMQCATTQLNASRVSLEHGTTREKSGMWSRKNEEYTADFLLITKRTLTEEEYQIFRYHYLLGADWRLCCRKLKMDKGNFFHSIYRIQQKLGRVFRELQPYSLFPLNEYFAGSRFDRGRAPVVAIRPQPNSLSSRVPLKRAA